MAWELAQINVGTIVAPIDSPELADFVARLDAVNALAEATPGFLWRLKDDASNNATQIKVTENPRFIVNMSVWTSVEALFGFAYQSSHRAVMVRRREWFERPAGSYQALWWVRAGVRPSIAEGLATLAMLDAHGPTPAAFTFRHAFPPPDRDDTARDLRPEPYCVGWS